MSFNRSPSFCGALVAVSLLSACGFQPVYGGGSNGGVAAAQATISLDNIPDREGVILRNKLLDRLPGGGSQNGAYKLTVRNLRKTVDNVGLKRDATFTRAEMNIDAEVELLDQLTGKTVLKKSVHVAGGYNLLDNQVATLVSEESVTTNLLTEMSDQIIRDINLRLSETAAP